MERKLLGLDVGGTKCAAVLGTPDGRVLARREWKSQAHRGPEAMLAELWAAAEGLMADAGGVAAAGCAVGGPLDAARGVVLSPPNLPGWDGIPLKALMQERLGVPARVDHDAAACALAEQRWGEGLGTASRLVYLTCGTGFGAGVVIDGVPYYGADGASLEIGHVGYREDGPAAFGRVGTFEAYGAGSGLGRLAAWRFPQRFDADTRPEDVSRRAAQGDADAQAVLDLNATATGDACALLGDLFRPDRIALGSLGRYLGETWVNAVVRRFRERVLPATARRCAIGPASLGERLQDLSSLAAAARALE